jgi:hypothetical protein
MKWLSTTFFDTLLVVALGALTLAAPGAGQAAPAPSITAVRATTAPTIDGVLDDKAWHGARVVSSFVQRSPSEGTAPRQRTELRLLYDDSAIYVALRMWDQSPDRIRRGLGKRDSPPDSDWVTLIIDPLMSRKRGYYFRVNASGVLADGIVFQETSADGSWDAVWSGAARVDGQGWTAEMKIPLTSIAFQDQPTQRWGLYVERYLLRHKETSSWPPMPKSSNTFVSRFGVLEGLKGLKRETALRLQPYAAGEIQLGRRSDALRPDNVLRPNGGLDLNYGLSGDLTLHATLNPDFGQVEDDAAVVNLSPNETFFGEKRPFFVAGAELFRTPLTLLHTRRIGARPWAPDAEHEWGEIVEVDPEARIIGAGKIVGEQGIASYGLLTALVLPSYAVERLPDGSEVERRATKGTHYGAGRLRLQLGRTSSIGAMFTGMTRINEELDTDAYAGGVDWDIRSSSGWQTTGQFTGATAEEGAGYGLKVMAGQRGAPRWRYWVDAESYSKDYEINDVGYQWRADMVRLKGSFERRLAAPWSIFRDGGVGVWTQHGFNHSDPSLVFERRVELWTWSKFRNLMGMWTGVGYLFAALDDRESRGGPAFPRPAEVYTWLGGETDTSRRFVFWGTSSYSLGGSGHTFNINGTLRASIFSRLNVVLFARYRLDRGETRWVDTLEQPARDRYLFANLDRDELEIKLSGLLCLHRLVTLQVFGQLLHSVGRHDNLRELYTLADGEPLLGPTTETTDPDFATTRLILNAILRWDLGAGTAAYLVYKMDGALDEEGDAVTSFDAGGALSRLTDDEQTHLLLLKVSYGFDL